MNRWGLKKKNSLLRFILNLICLGESECYVFLIIFPFTHNRIMIERERVCVCVLFLCCFLLPFNHVLREREGHYHLWPPPSLRFHYCHWKEESSGSALTPPVGNRCRKLDMLTPPLFSHGIVVTGSWCHATAVSLPDLVAAVGVSCGVPSMHTLHCRCKEQ